MTESFALSRARRPRKPKGSPPLLPWWFLAVCVVLVVACLCRDLLQGDYAQVAIEVGFGVWLTERAVQAWRWDRFNRWNGGR